MSRDPGLVDEMYQKLHGGSWNCRTSLAGQEVLEWPVAAVATLGELAAAVTAPCRSTWPLLYPESLHQDLREFIWTLRDTLDHGDVTSLGQRGVTPLGQALATFGATPGATWADVRAAVRGWQKLVDELEENWCCLAEDAADLLDDLEDRATTRATAEDTDEETDEDTAEETDEETDEDTTTAWDGDLMDDSTGWGTSGDNLVATAQQAPMALTMEEVYSMVDKLIARVEVVKKAVKEAMVATSRAGTATRRGQQAESAMGLLGRLVVECENASLLTLELHERLQFIKTTLEGTEEASPDVLEALLAAVAEFERLWEASARLATRHLLGTLEDICRLLSNPYGGSAGPSSSGGPGGSGDLSGPGDSGGPGGRSVAKRRQEAIEDTRWPSKKQRPTPFCSETNNSSSITGTPQQPEAAPVSVAESDILSVGSAFGCANSICASRQSLGCKPVYSYPGFQTPFRVLEWPVAAVATLGELAAAVTAPCRSTWPLLYPESLHQDLREFIWTLRDTLDHGDVTSLGQRGVTPLGQALATFGATPGATWADVRAAVRGWQKLVDELEENWCCLAEDAADLLDDLEDRATTRATAEDTDEETDEDTAEETDEETDEDTTTAWDGDLMDDSTGWGTSGDNLVATAQQAPMALTMEEVYSMVDKLIARVEVVKKAVKEAMVATSRAGTATRRGQQAESAMGLLGRLVVECENASLLTLELHERLQFIKTTLEGTEEASPDVLEALLAAVAEFERLWEASARLATRHLLGTLEDICRLLSNPYGGSAGPSSSGGPGGSGDLSGPGDSGGPGGHSVAKRRQEAIEDTRPEVKINLRKKSAFLPRPQVTITRRFDSSLV
ncbi:hypothetical protein DUI87_06262 [Hirundo rustica rustica]|uniref:Uncharacterized protein n=1 Tax=Hirundo rustica rustica TaxID=333673 RepID=A0A3M0KV28_HIRRU|nr:hypothetical protein DUI87_06262 [Hirundo rustica rustica]